MRFIDRWVDTRLTQGSSEKGAVLHILTDVVVKLGKKELFNNGRGLLGWKCESRMGLDLTEFIRSTWNLRVDNGKIWTHIYRGWSSEEISNNTISLLFSFLIPF